MCRLIVAAVLLLACASSHPIRAEEEPLAACADWIIAHGVDNAIQLHGAGGLSEDFPLATSFAYARSLRFADGPDEVHARSLGRAELNRYG